MRIVHLSDIHLSKSNYIEFNNNYLDALINDLKAYNYSKKIDVIVITGDLIDKGGHSLYEINGFEDKTVYPNPYDIFEKIFIEPIMVALSFPKENILFIPGNHDVDESLILLKEEYELTKNIETTNINEFLKENSTLKHSQRIKNFKEFEYKFHNKNSNYAFTNNQSTFIYKFKDINIGFLLVNDSWRCKSIRLYDDNEKLFLGMQQLYDGLNNLKRFDTKLNVLLVHHGTDNFVEKEEIEGFFLRNEIELVLYGHYHSSKTSMLYSSFGNCIAFRSRTTLLNPNEIDDSYKSGYQVMDIDLASYKIIEVHYRKYNNKPDAKIFIPDNEVAENGVDRNKTNSNLGFNFFREKKGTILSKVFNKSQFES